MISTFLFYTIFSSVILIYGVGLNTATIVCDSFKSLALPVVKVVSAILGSSAVSWAAVKYILVPLGITAIYPLVAILVFFSISVFLEVLIRIVTGRVASEYNFSFLIVILSLNESVGILDVLLISFSSIFAFVFLLPLLYSLKNRIDIAGNTAVHGNRKALLLVSIAVLVLALLSGNVSWLNPGVLR